jgi:hypothetical protein
MNCRKCVLYFIREQTQLRQLLEENTEYQHVFYVTGTLQSVRRGNKMCTKQKHEREMVSICRQYGLRETLRDCHNDKQANTPK